MEGRGGTILPFHQISHWGLSPTTPPTILASYAMHFNILQLTHTAHGINASIGHKMCVHFTEVMWRNGEGKDSYGERFRP